MLHGAGNGMITIAKGTLPLAIFGPAGYGRRNGILSVPTRIAEASAPLVFGLLLTAIGSRGGPRHGRAVPVGLCLAVAAAQPVRRRIGLCRAPETDPAGRKSYTRPPIAR